MKDVIAPLPGAIQTSIRNAKKAEEKYQERVSAFVNKTNASLGKCKNSDLPKIGYRIVMHCPGHPSKEYINMCVDYLNACNVMLYNCEAYPKGTKVFVKPEGVEETHVVQGVRRIVNADLNANPGLLGVIIADAKVRD